MIEIYFKFQGKPGLQGESGERGERGFTGVTGTVGPQGIPVSYLKSVWYFSYFFTFLFKFSI